LNWRIQRQRELEQRRERQCQAIRIKASQSLGQSTKDQSRGDNDLNIIKELIEREDSVTLFNLSLVDRINALKDKSRRDVLLQMHKLIHTVEEQETGAEDEKRLGRVNFSLDKDLEV